MYSSNDAAHGNFSGHNPAAKAAVEQAAADVEALLPGHLGAVGTDVFTGSANGATVKFDWTLSYPNPATGQTVSVGAFTAAQDVVTIYAGMRPLSGNALSASAFSV